MQCCHAITVSGSSLSVVLEEQPHHISMATVGRPVEGSGPTPWSTGIGGGTRFEEELTDIGVATSAGIVL